MDWLPAPRCSPPGRDAPMRLRSVTGPAVPAKPGISTLLFQRAPRRGGRIFSMGAVWRAGRAGRGWRMTGNDSKCPGFRNWNPRNYLTSRRYSHSRASRANSRFFAEFPGNGGGQRRAGQAGRVKTMPAVSPSRFLADDAERVTASRPALPARRHSEAGWAALICNAFARHVSDLRRCHPAWPSAYLNPFAGGGAILCPTQDGFRAQPAKHTARRGKSQIKS